MIADKKKNIVRDKIKKRISVKVPHDVREGRGLSAISNIFYSVLLSSSSSDFRSFFFAVPYYFIILTRQVRKLEKKERKKGNRTAAILPILIYCNLYEKEGERERKRKGDRNVTFIRKPLDPWLDERKNEEKKRQKNV